MTKVTFYLSQDEFTAVDISGHAGYAEEGEDIVCAAISSTIQLTHALLSDVRGLVFDTLIEDEGAHIRMTLNDDVVEAAQDAFEALRLFYRELEETYSEFICVTEVYENAED